MAVVPVDEEAGKKVESTQSSKKYETRRWENDVRIWQGVQPW